MVYTCTSEYKSLFIFEKQIIWHVRNNKNLAYHLAGNCCCYIDISSDIIEIITLAGWNKSPKGH